MKVKIEELENGLKITETIGSNVVFRYITSYGFPFIRSTNEAGETYQVVDTVGEIYNLPALPSEFILESITGNIYLSSTGDELVENSLHLKPFRSENLDDRVISIGNITAGSSFVNVPLHSSGINSVYINGTLREKYLPDYFNFTPVTTGIKVLIIYAKDDAQIFYLAEGTESTEAIEPIYSGLKVALLIASPTGVVVEESNTDFKQKLEDYWLNWYVTSQSKVILSTYDARGSFYITKSASATGSVTIGGLSKIVPATEDAAKIFYEGREFLIYNATGENLIIDSTGVSGVDTFLIANKLTPYTVKNNNAIKVKIRGGELELLPSGSDPDLSGYLQKPPADGIWVVTHSGGVTTYTDASTLGKNIFNTNLTLADNQTQNLNGKTLYFTGSGTSKFKLDYLFLAPKTANSIGDKIWHDGVDIWYTNSSGFNEKFLRNVNTIEQKSISTTGVALTLSELNSFGTERVDCPNLNRVYLKVGFKWMYFNLTEVV